MISYKALLVMLRSFSRRWSSIELAKLGVSGDWQTSASRKTIRISLLLLNFLVSHPAVVL